MPVVILFDFVPVHVTISFKVAELSIADETVLKSIVDKSHEFTKDHDDVIKWNTVHVTGLSCGEFKILPNV